MPAPRRRSVLVEHLARGAAPGARPVVLDELRRCLLDGEVPPGSPIPPDEVAEVFGVSRIPVREALKTLVGEGLVEHRPNSGYAVARLSRAELDELYLVRGVLETAALNAAVVRAGPADDAAARAAHDALGAAVADGDERAYHRESRNFHRALVGACGMRRLLGMYESAWNITEPIRPMAHVGRADRAALHAEHGEMLAAFLARDAAALAEVAARHHGRLRTALHAVPDHTGLLTEPD